MPETYTREKIHAEKYSIESSFGHRLDVGLRYVDPAPLALQMVPRTVQLALERYAALAKLGQFAEVPRGPEAADEQKEAAVGQRGTGMDQSGHEAYRCFLSGHEAHRMMMTAAAAPPPSPSPPPLLPPSPPPAVELEPGTVSMIGYQVLNP